MEGQRRQRVGAETARPTDAPPPAPGRRPPYRVPCRRPAIGVEGALPPRLLAEAIRVAFDPDARVDMARRALGRPAEGGCEPAAAGPVAAQDDWLRYRTDGAWHA